MKKSCLATLLLILVLMFCLSASALAASFSDTNGHWAEDSIETWKDAGLLSGYPDGTFLPNRSMNRAEFATVLNAILQYPAQGSVSFSDVASTAWYYEDVTALAEAGIVEGEAFRPTDEITREEAVVMFAKALDLTTGGEASFSDQAEIEATALPYIQAMVDAGYLGGYPDGSFRPAGSLTRAETVQVLSNAATVINGLLGSPVSASNDLDQYLISTATLSDGARALPIDRSKTNEHALSGYYHYTFSNGALSDRSFSMYFGRHAALRAYITVIAIPEGVSDTQAFLQEEGWLTLADTYGELLFILEPGSEGWGSPAEEAAYLETCLGEVIGNSNFDSRATSPGGIVQSGRIPLSDGTEVAVFTGHACNYYVGYGEACAVLESWTAQNPLYVIGQAFIGGTSVGADYLAEAATRTYGGINTGSYYPGFSDADFTATLQAMQRDGAISSASYITNADVPVPTLFAGYSNGDASVEHWKSVNDVVATADAQGVYRQSINSTAWQTSYFNSLAQSWNPRTTYGISQVQLLNNDSPSAAQIRDFLAVYTRYTFQWAYGNTLGYRLDYYQATNAARATADSGRAQASHSYTAYNGDTATVELRALESARVSAPGSTGGTVYAMISAFADYNDDGVLDPRECLVYVPDSVSNNGSEGAPVVVVFPGSTQASITFMDCSAWWAVANEEGCVVIIVGQFCNTSAASLAYGGEEDNANFARSSLVLLDNEVSKQANIAIDFSRVYGSGHSAGSNAIQTLCNNTEAYYFAAVASTSFPNSGFTADLMPAYLIVGQSDISEPLPDTRARDLVKDPWIVTEDSAIYNWVSGMQKMNGIEAPFTANDHASFLAACSSHDESGRYYTYSWANDDGVVLTQFTRTLAREHNCYAEEFRLAWDFLVNYRLDADGTRYYSPSGFTVAGDEIEITKD